MNIWNYSAPLSQKTVLIRLKKTHTNPSKLFWYQGYCRVQKDIIVKIYICKFIEHTQVQQIPN